MDSGFVDVVEIAGMSVGRRPVLERGGRRRGGGGDDGDGDVGWWWDGKMDGWMGPGVKQRFDDGRCSVVLEVHLVHHASSRL